MVKKNVKTPREVFKHTSEKYLFECPKCKKNLLSSLNNISNGKFCSKCSNAGYSKVSITWLNFMEIQYNTKIQHHLNIGEYKIPDTNWKADGYSEEFNIIFEYDGDFWHGNPIYYNSNDINPISKKTYGELYTITINRINTIKQKGYKVVQIWDSEWKHFINIIKKFQRNFRNRSTN